MPPAVNVGDRFCRTFAPDKVFRVLRIDPTRQPYSVTLMSACPHQAFVTIGADRLLDPVQWLPIKAAAHVEHDREATNLP